MRRQGLVLCTASIGMALSLGACGSPSGSVPTSLSSSCRSFSAYVTSLSSSRAAADQSAIAAEQTAFESAGSPADLPDFNAAVEGESNNSGVRAAGYASWGTTGCRRGSALALLGCVRTAATKAESKMAEAQFLDFVISQPPEPVRPPDVSTAAYSALVQADMSRRRVTDTSELVFQAAGLCVREVILGDHLAPPSLTDQAAAADCARSPALSVGPPVACGVG